MPIQAEVTIKCVNGHLVTATSLPEHGLLWAGEGGDPDEDPLISADLVLECNQALAEVIVGELNGSGDREAVRSASGILLNTLKKFGNRHLQQLSQTPPDRITLRGHKEIVRSLFFNFLPVGDTRLDTLSPISLITDHTPREDRRPPKIVILYHPGHVFDEPGKKKFEFYEIARHVFDEIPDTMVSLYEGERFMGEGSRMTLWREIMTKHRAVVFLGHGSMNPPGWHLCDGENGVLTFEEIRAFLGPNAGAPELLLSLSCSGSASFEALGGHTLYPADFFLDGGVSKFIGSPIDIIVETNKQWETLKDFTVRFLKKWAKDQRDVSGHLYSAKKDLKFPVIASLFQLYESPPCSHVPVGAEIARQITPATGADSETLPVENYSEGERGEVPADSPLAIVDQSRDPVSLGAIAGDITEGDAVGTYVLEKMMWENDYSKTFTASVTGESGSQLPGSNTGRCMAD